MKYKLYIRPYQIKSKNRILDGSLLLFEFHNDLVGYADLLPHPQFYESTLFSQLNDLKNQNKTSLKLTLLKELAFQDALARKEGRNLFFGLNIPKSHFFIKSENDFKDIDQIIEQGFCTIKMKCSCLKDLKILPELHKTYPQIKWRLDFNSQFSVQSWTAIKKILKPLGDTLEFIEDPFINPEVFKQDGTKFFAIDWNKKTPGFIRIIKPSRDPVNLELNKLAQGLFKKLVFTHSGESFLGAAAAAYVAAKFYQKHPQLLSVCGLQPFEHDITGFQLKQHTSPYFSKPHGYGLGFQNILENQKWKRWL